MDQLVVLQEIYESFSKGGDGLQKISSRAIEGSCPELTARLLESAKKGEIDEDIFCQLSGCLVDVYEIKRLGDICRSVGMYALAIQNYNRALSLCRDQVLRPVLQNNLGQAYARQGDLARAAFYYKKSACCFEKSGDLTGLAHVLGNLGSAYRQNRDWDQAIEYCYRSLKTFEEKGDDLGIAQMTGSLGRIYADMGERDLAARYFERSLEDFQKLGDGKSAAWILDRMGRIASDRYDWDSAQNCYRHSLALFEEQGQTQSKGIVLSNLGRMLLEKGEASSARESLEEAILLIGRNARPGFQNALSSLAATYSTLAISCLQEAEDNEDLGLGSGRLQRQEAANNFSRSSDRFQELASALPGFETDILTKAEIARCRSYLARISGYTPDEEAVDLADKALESLDSAAGAANVSETGKAGIRALEKTISGMREARMIGLLGDEPWRLSKSIKIAIDHLLAGAKECEAADVNASIVSALENFQACLNERRDEEDPAKRLNAAAEDLRHAGKRLSALKRDPKERDARRLIESAAILQGQTGVNEINDQPGEGERRRNQLCFGPERDAILLIAGAMANSLLEEIDDTREILTWDESLNLIPNEKRIDIDILNENEGEICERDEDYEVEKAADLQDLLTDLEISEDRAQAQDLILADGTVEPSEYYVSEIVYPEESWLVPVAANTPCRKANPIAFQSWRQAQFYGSCGLDRLEKPKDDRENIDEGIDTGLIEELKRHDFSGEKVQQEMGLEDAGQEVQEPISELSDQAIKEGTGLFSREKAIILIKAMTVLVILLMAVEAVLYLI